MVALTQWSNVCLNWKSTRAFDRGVSVPSCILDRRCGWFRVDRVIPKIKSQQHHSACLPSPERLKSKKGLIGFGKPGWQRRLEQAIRQWWFEKTLPAKLDAAEAEWHRSQPPDMPPPTVVEHPINDNQTGTSRLLGGPISIHAPWNRDQQDPPA